MWAERARTGGAGQARAVRTAHGELQGQPSSHGGARGHPGGDTGATAQGGPGAPRPARQDRGTGRAGAPGRVPDPRRQRPQRRSHDAGLAARKARTRCRPRRTRPRGSERTVNANQKVLQKILVVRYSALGDVVLATSVLDPLLATFPGARIEWVTDAAYAPLLEGLPQIAAVHTLDREGPQSAVSLRDRLSRRFDLAIDLQNKVRSAVIARAAAPRRVTFRRRPAGRALL